MRPFFSIRCWCGRPHRRHETNRTNNNHNDKKKKMIIITPSLHKSIHAALFFSGKVSFEMLAVTVTALNFRGINNNTNNNYYYCSYYYDYY